MPKINQSSEFEQEFLNCSFAPLSSKSKWRCFHIQIPSKHHHYKVSPRKHPHRHEKHSPATQNQELHAPAKYALRNEGKLTHTQKTNPKRPFFPCRREPYKHTWSCEAKRRRGLSKDSSQNRSDKQNGRTTGERSVFWEGERSVDGNTKMNSKRFLQFYRFIF